MIKEKVGVAQIEERMREFKLRWFGYVKSMSVDSQGRKCETISFLECKRGRGRPKKSCNKVTKYDLIFIGLTKDMTQDRSL